MFEKSDSGGAQNQLASMWNEWKSWLIMYKSPFVDQYTILDVILCLVTSLTENSSYVSVHPQTPCQSVCHDVRAEIMAMSKKTVNLQIFLERYTSNLQRNKTSSMAKKCWLKQTYFDSFDVSSGVNPALSWYHFFAVQIDRISTFLVKQSYNITSDSLHYH